ncbi:MAG: hypothetical protein IIC53_12875 [Proteobacteria bacterium]|nr:hypothetical protein [Pseudomonadota bacterium]
MREPLADPDDGAALSASFARTREIEPSLTIVCLFRDGDSLRVSPNDPEEVSLATPRSFSTMRKLVQRPVHGRLPDPAMRQRMIRYVEGL